MGSQEIIGHIEDLLSELRHQRDEFGVDIPEWYLQRLEWIKDQLIDLEKDRQLEHYKEIVEKKKF